MSPRGAIKNIFIIGGIATGKSTLANLIKKTFPNILYIPEPYEDNPFLSLLMDDPSRWSFACQLYFLWDYIKVFKDEIKTKGIQQRVIDTGAWVNKEVYMQYLYDTHTITEAEFSLYHKLCEDLVTDADYPKPDIIIKLEASLPTIFQRMQKRGWEFQVGKISEEYINSINTYIEKMGNLYQSKGIQVVTINTEHIDYTKPEGEKRIIQQLTDSLRILP
jgi:deoxyadenosine/deoxycytidine kinase